MGGNGGKENERKREVVLETALVLEARYKKEVVDSSFFSFFSSDIVSGENQHN